MSDRVAMMQLHHFRQLIKSGTFSQFDFGQANLRIYKSLKPPKYDLSQVKVPVYLYAASEDWLVSPRVSKHIFITKSLSMTSQNLCRMSKSS